MILLVVIILAVGLFANNALDMAIESAGTRALNVGAVPDILLETGGDLIKAGAGMGKGATDAGKNVGDGVLKGVEDVGIGIGEGLKGILKKKEKEK